MNSLPTHDDVCPACRRNKALCICVSHAPFIVPRPGADEAQPAAVQSVEAKINEAMKLYYNRDAAGLMAFLRRVIR